MAVMPLKNHGQKVGPVAIVADCTLSAKLFIVIFPALTRRSCELGRAFVSPMIRNA